MTVHPDGVGELGHLVRGRLRVRARVRVGVRARVRVGVRVYYTSL